MIPLFKPWVRRDAEDAVAEVLGSGMIGEGPETFKFAQELSSVIPVKNLTLLNSATSALVLALRLAGVSAGSKVLSTPYTFVATNCAISDVGGEIVWGSLDESSACLSPACVIETVRRRKIDAVMFVSVGGLLPDGFGKMVDVLRERKIPLIVDAAHALTTTYRDKHISEWCNYCCFSFQAIKHLTTGDGGALTCLSDSDQERAERLKWFGMSRRIPDGVTRLQHQMEYSIPEYGQKLHMNDIAAAIGRRNLVDLDTVVSASIKNAESLSDFVDQELPDSVAPLKSAYHSEPSCWVWGIRIFQDLGRQELLDLCDQFAALGVQASPLWKMNSEHECFPDSEYKQPPYLFFPNGWWVKNEDLRIIQEALLRVFVKEE